MLFCLDQNFAASLVECRTPNLLHFPTQNLWASSKVQVHRDNLFAQFKNYLHIYISKIKMLLNTFFYLIFLHQIIRVRKSYTYIFVYSYVLYFHSWIWRSLVVHIFKEAHFYCMKPQLIQWIILPPLSSKELWVGKRKVI